MAEPVSKKRKVVQCFRSAYTEEFPRLIKSTKGPLYPFCSSDTNISHSGKYDCKTHVNGSKHKQLVSSKQRNITSMFQPLSDKEETHSHQVIRAEAEMAIFIAKKNLSFSVSSELPQLFKKMAPDSAIVKEIKCGPSKTTALVKEIGTIYQEKLVEIMKTSPFTISTDGSNDMEKTKLFPLVVRCVTESGVHSQLLSVPTIDGSATGEAIFKAIDNELVKHDIPWKNCIALGCDNASVMTGQKKGVISFCVEKHKNIHLSGCPLHLVHIGAEKGADVFPVSVSELLVDIFFYFNKSSLRSHNLSKYQEIFGKEPLRMLKHVSTRWLSIGRCLSRLLDNWDPLTSFFIDEIKKDLSAYAKEKSEKILRSLKSRSSRLYCMFLEYSSKIFVDFQTSNQSEDPKAATMAQQCNKLLRQILVRFVKPCAFAGNKLVTDVQFKMPYNVKEDKDLMIGEKCSSYIKNKAKNGLASSRIKEFYNNVKKYYSTFCEYLLRKLPLTDPVLLKLSLADPLQLGNSSVHSIRYFAERFPILVSADTTTDGIMEQFLELQIADLVQSVTMRADDFWVKVRNFKDPTGAQPFQHIAIFALGLLTIPHSSAHCERLFSSVRKIKTDQRSSMQPEALQALLVVKTNDNFNSDFTKDELKQLKSCYSKSLQSAHV